jgi:uncharacterized protein (TIGR03086 family)
MTDVDSLDQLSNAVAETGRLVSGIADDQWNNATPCTEWDVRDLVGHLVDGSRRLVDVLAAGTAPPARPSRPPASVLTDDPVRDFYQASDALLAAFAQPGKLSEMVPSPFGTVPAAVMLQLRIVEHLVHGSDLARATGQAMHVPPGLAEQALAFSQEYVGNLPPDRRPFARPQHVDPDAPPLDHLVALLGRSTPGPP